MAEQRNWSHILIAGAVCWLLLVALVSALSWPYLPRSVPGWALFAVVAPALYVVGEGVGSWLFSREHGMNISRSKFSVARVLVALVVIAVGFGAFWWLLSLVLTN